MLKVTDWKPFFYIPGLEVQGTGKLRRTMNGKTEDLAIQVGNNGRKFLYIDGRRNTVDYLVASCFCHRESKEHKYIEHIDGDMGNDTFSNLRWTDQLPGIGHSAAPIAKN